MLRWRYVIQAALRRLFSRRRLDDQLRDDLDFHLEQTTAEYMCQGLSADDARRAARRSFGNATQTAEEIREMSIWVWWDRLVQDVRYGLRTFRRSPAFALTAVLSLALGIGATTAVFSLVNAVLLRPLPVSRPEQLVVINPRSDFSYPHYLEFRDATSAFTDLVGASRVSRASVDAGAGGEQAWIKIVTGNYFSGLGVSASVGRLLTSADDREQVAVISHRYWSRRFGESADIVGRAIRIHGLPFTIVGVTARSFLSEAPGDAPDLWVPVAFQVSARRDDRGYSWLNVIGRLKNDVTPQQAAAELSALPARTGAGLQGIEVVPGKRGLAGLRATVADPLLILMAIAMVVLLIACMNVGSLMLTRAAAREGEIAMRLAIGAGRCRVMRQLLTESALLAAASGVLGLLFAVWASGALVQLASAAAPALVLDIAPDWRVLLFTAVVSLAAAMLFGLAPALRTVRATAAGALRESSQRLVSGAEPWSMRDVFVVAQLALSIILLAGMAMFSRTLGNLEAQDLGFDVNDVVMAELMPERGYRPVVPTLIPRLVERAQAIPGVAAATVVFNGPLGGSSGVNGLQVDGFTPTGPQDQRARADWVGPNYFGTAGVPLVAGRDFTFADTSGAPRVAVINQTMARHFFRDGVALGRRFTFNKNEYLIVGIVKDAKYTDLREAPPRMVYFALLQGGAGPNGLAVRTAAGEAAAIAAALRAAIREVDPRLSAGDILPLSARLRRTLVREHLLSDLSGFFAAFALLLASIGMYGTLAYTAARRTKEIAIRLALGSRRGAVVWMVLRAVIVRVAMGLLIGLIGILAGGRFIAAMLFGLRPTDPATIALAALTLTVVAILAGCLPAFRASRLDPATVLRE